jgi:hypothetical protein
MKGNVFQKALQALGFSKSPSAIAIEARGGVLTPGQYYRVWANVDETYVTGIYDAAPATFGQTAVQEHLAADLVKLGFLHPLLVVQDPSDAKVWTFLSQWQPVDPRHTSPVDVGAIHFTRFDPVEEPSRVSPLVDVPSLDAGLSEDDLYVVRRVLQTDNDPKRLAGLARCFDEDFPIVASILRNKARLENLSRCVNLEIGPVRVDERVTGTLSPLSAIDHPSLDAIKDSARDLDLGECLDLYSNVFQILDWTPPQVAQDHGHDDLFAFEPELQAIPANERETGFCKMLTLLSRTPDLADAKNIPDLAKKTDLPRALVAAGIAAVSSHGHGLVTLDPAMVRALRPRGPRPVSLGALKMAHAILRPEGSLAAAPAELSDVLTDLNKAVRRGDPMAIKAEESLKRARRFLDRQNWTAWVRRYEEAEGL